MAGLARTTARSSSGPVQTFDALPITALRRRAAQTPPHRCRPAPSPCRSCLRKGGTRTRRTDPVGALTGPPSDRPTDGPVRRRARGGRRIGAGAAGEIRATAVQPVPYPRGSGTLSSSPVLVMKMTRSFAGFVLLVFSVSTW